MKVKNLTNYDTRYLRKLFLACEKHSFITYLKHSHPKYRTVRVENARRYTNGYAWINGSAIGMRLPKPVNAWKSVNARSVARVYLHEIGHCLGLRHKQMITSSKLDVSWWPDELVPVKQVVEKPKPNIVEVRAANAQKKLDEWQHKASRAKTFVKKYQRRVRYYERKMAASKQ